ncbi:MAG: hypothetical protein KDC87_02155 [Planctomycetes bacterium]|nr:hypothetical protein [Planctomycetota bacterium]MCB9888867.1 hypothetical protein [Planctomycetota bacterium]
MRVALERVHEPELTTCKSHVQSTGFAPSNPMNEPKKNAPPPAKNPAPKPAPPPARTPTEKTEKKGAPPARSNPPQKPR